MFAFDGGEGYNIGMYLISLYFDEKTNRKICSLMDCVAEKSGNTDMIGKHVPPHITLTAFESREREDVLVDCLDVALHGLKAADIYWVSVAAFFPQVIYLVPVLNESLHTFSDTVARALESCDDTKIQECYKPFGWLPHTTVGRRLSPDQMQQAFEALQTAFVPFEGRVVRIGFSTGSPKREITYWDLV